MPSALVRCACDDCDGIDLGGRRGRTGAGPGMADEDGSDHVDVYFCPITPAMPFIRDGKLLALAVSSSKRASALPNVPTTVEAGYPDSDFDFWIGMFVPKKTPRDIVARIHQETVNALEDPGVKDKLAKLGVEPLIMTPEAFDARIAKEAPIAVALAKAAGIAVK